SLEPFPFVHTPQQVILSKSTSRNDVRRLFDILADSSHLSGRIEELYLWDSTTTTADLEQLPELPLLARLELDRTPVDDGCTAALARFPRLQSLSLADTAIGDGALAVMPSLPKLHSLDLSGTQVTEEGLRSLPHLSSIRWIDLRLTPAVTSHW